MKRPSSNGQTLTAIDCGEVVFPAAVEAARCGAARCGGVEAAVARVGRVGVDHGTWKTGDTVLRRNGVRTPNSRKM